MGIRVQSKIDWKAKGDALQKAASTGLELGLQRIIADLKNNFASGKGSDGSTLKPYSKQYARYRELKRKRTDIVDFTLTRGLLRSIASRVDQRGKKLIGSVFTPSHANVVDGLSKDRPNAFKLTKKMLEVVKSFINAERIK